MKQIILILGLSFGLSCSANSIKTININKKDSTGATPLMIASGLGDFEKVSELVNRGADINILDDQMGVTALHRASQSGNVKIIELLLKKGAFIDDQSSVNGHTPLLDAAFYKRYSAIEYLLKKGANPALKNTLGLNVMDWGKRQKDEKIIQLLNDQILRDQKKEKDQLLFNAVKEGNQLLVLKLLQEGHDANQVSKDGSTPLHWACKFGQKEIVKLLLQFNANPNKRDRVMKATSGHKAAFFGHAEILDLLIQAGLKMNLQGPYNGYTALHDSLLNSHEEASKILINSGASLDIKGIDGKTAREIAKERNIFPNIWLK